MIVELGNSKFNVYWTYEDDTKAIETKPVLSNTTKTPKIVTTCYIEDIKDGLKNGKVVALGYAFCCQKDKHVKEVGRKLSLDRAGDELSTLLSSPTKTVKSKLFESYFLRGKT